MTLFGFQEEQIIRVSYTLYYRIDLLVLLAGLKPVLTREQGQLT